MRRALVGLNAAALVTALLFVVLTSSSPTPLCIEDNNCDALVFRSVAEALHQGRIPYTPWELGGLTLDFAYPPWALPLFALYAHGRLAMLALGLTGVGGLAWLARRHGPLFTLLAVGGGWTFFSVWLGQTGALMGIAGFGLAGVWGLPLLLLKPQFAPLAVVALARAGRWRDLLVAAGVIAVSSAAVTAWLGPEVWPAWWDAITRAPPELDRSFMSSWQAWVPSLPAWVGLLPVGIGAAVVWRSSAPPVAMALALAPVVSPHAHPYDLALWVPAAACTSRPVRDLALLAAVSHAAVLTGTRFLLPCAGLWLAWRLLDARDPRPESGCPAPR